MQLDPEPHQVHIPLVQSLIDRLYPRELSHVPLYPTTHSSLPFSPFSPLARNQLENTGNFPDFTEVHNVSYWECVYFLMVTMSTVGFGDVVCTTTLGRIGIVCFLLFGLVSGRGGTPDPPASPTLPLSTKWS